jgi:uncharacterized protein with GYD domain
MLRFQFNAASSKAMVETPQDRMTQARSIVEAFGGKLHNYFFCFGDFDGVGISEFPDNKSATAFVLKVTATGAFSKFETTVLMTTAEAQAAMKQAHDTNPVYRPPNA